MNTEQLTLILDAAGKAGDGAFWIAIFWLLSAPLIVLLVCLTLAYISHHVVAGFLSAAHYRRTLDRVAALINYNDFDITSFYDRNRLIQKLERLQSEHKSPPNHPYPT